MITNFKSVGIPVTVSLSEGIEIVMEIAVQNKVVVRFIADHHTMAVMMTVNPFKLVVIGAEYRYTVPNCRCCLGKICNLNSTYMYIVGFDINEAYRPGRGGKGRAFGKYRAFSGISPYFYGIGSCPVLANEILPGSEPVSTASGIYDIAGFCCGPGFIEGEKRRAYCSGIAIAA
jgi:hypothetical protein